MLKDVRHELAVFEEEGANTPTLDHVQLNLYLKRLGLGPKPNLNPQPSALATIPRSKWKWLGSHWSVSFERSALEFRLALGHHAGGDGTISASVRGNIHVRLRERLLRAGALRPSSPPGLRGSNFIEAECLLPPVTAADLHRAAIRELWILVHDARRLYLVALAKFFGLHLQAQDVGASVAQIELSWDRPCRIARAATTILWPAFRDTFYGATVYHGREDDEDEAIVGVRATEATEYREEDAAPGAGVLRANGVRGGCTKLYAKTHHHLRFEFEPTGERAKDLLRRSIRLADQRDLREDLERLAAPPYALLLRAQRALTSDSAMSWTDVFRAFGVAGLPMLEAFEAGAKFHNAGGKRSKVLARLRGRGLAVHLGRGFWGPMPDLAHSLQRHRRLDPIGGGTP